jgi:hypothetical protein
MFEDRSGSLSGSGLVDFYDRMHLRVRCTRRDPDGASQYGVYNMFSTQCDIAVATLEYGAAGALGNITIVGPGGMPRTQAMAAFLVEVGGYVRRTPSPRFSALFCIHTHTPVFSGEPFSPRHRKFIASDGKEYSWSWRTNARERHEWSVSNSNF